MLAFQASVGIRTALAAQHQRKMENPLDYCVRCMGVAFEQAARVSKTREAWDVRTAELGTSMMNMQLKSVEINSRLDLFCIHNSACRLCCHADVSTEVNQESSEFKALMDYMCQTSGGSPPRVAKPGDIPEQFGQKRRNAFLGHRSHDTVTAIYRISREGEAERFKDTWTILDLS